MMLPEHGFAAAAAKWLAVCPEGCVCMVPACANGRMPPRQAPRNGGPFILSARPLPELVASAAAVAKRCRLLAACFGGLGAALVVGQVVRTTLKARRRRRLRRAQGSLLHVSALRNTRQHTLQWRA